MRPPFLILLALPAIALAQDNPTPEQELSQCYDDVAQDREFNWQLHEDHFKLLEEYIQCQTERYRLTAEAQLVKELKKITRELKRGAR